jgi:pimeloyl-ACP methyl ester carboxylesterase
MRVIAFDNRGAGKSSRPDYPYTMEMFREDTRALLDHLKIHDPVHLCGFSLGGMIAQEFVLRYPNRVKSLVLLATGPYIEPMKFEQGFNFYKQFEQLNFAQKLQLVIPLIYTSSFKRKLRKNEALFERIKKDLNPIIHSNDIPETKDYINQWKALKNLDTRDALHKIKQPTLIMVGENDSNSSFHKSKQLHEGISDSTLHIFKKLKHGFIIEEPQEINNFIWSFIKQYLR